MTNHETIGPGDIVSVCFDYHPEIHDAKVLGVPQATGDSWKLDDHGVVIYVQSFTKMILVHKESDHD